MKIKLIRLLLVAVFFNLYSFSTIFSQQMQIGLKIGAGLGISKQEISDGNVEQLEGNVVSFSEVKKSYGDGVSLSGDIQIKLNEFLGTGITLSYLKGKNTQKEIIFTNRHRIDNFSGDMLLVKPELILYLPFNSVNIYTKIGVLIGLNGQIIRKKEDQLLLNTYTTELFSGGTSIGISNAVGIKKNISKRFSIAIEVVTNTHSFAPIKRETIESFENGESNLDELMPAERITNYRDEYIKDFGSSTHADLSVPGVSLKRYYSFNRLEFNIGISYLLNSKKN